MTTVCFKSSMFGEKEGKVRMYESGVTCIIDVYGICVYLPAMENNTHREKKTEVHVKLDIKQQHTNRMMSMTS